MFVCSRKKIILSAVLMGILLVAGTFFFGMLRSQDQGRPKAPIKPTAIMAPSRADVHIKGVTLRRGSENGMLCTLAIGEMKVVKKKVGFFRIGGLRQLEVADLDIHVDMSDPDPRSLARDKHSEQSERESPLNDVFRSFRTSLESMTGGISLSGLEGKRVSLEANRLGQQLLFLKADTLSLTRKKKLLLEGKVLVEMRGQVWRGKRVVIDPGTMKMKMGKAREVSLRQLIGRVS